MSTFAGFDETNFVSQFIGPDYEYNHGSSRGGGLGPKNAQKRPKVANFVSQEELIG